MACWSALPQWVSAAATPAGATIPIENASIGLCGAVPVRATSPDPLPAAESEQLQGLAETCVVGLDCFRVPPDVEELARRRATGLSTRQEEMMARFGYLDLPPALEVLQHPLVLGASGVMTDGNPMLLKEMVRNLVDNAIHYTPSSAEHPGMITVRVLADTARQLLLLQVEDSGLGIALAERELVFEPFYRALGTQADGSGLGLSIVSEIARQHGAEVSIAETRPGHHPPGARFSVQFKAPTATA